MKIAKLAHGSFNLESLAFLPAGNAYAAFMI